MSSDHQLLTRINQHYLSAYGNGDVAWFEEVLADSTGLILDKTAFLEKIAGQPKPSAPLRLEAEELEIRIVGGVAIVHAIPMLCLPDGPVKVRGRYTDVYVRLNNEWRYVAAHLGVNQD